MSRYNNPAKKSKIQPPIIMLEQDFEQALPQSREQSSSSLQYRKFKSIPSKKMFLQQSDLQQQDDNINNLIPEKQTEQVQIVHASSKQSLKLNNFFGSKKVLERPVENNIIQTLNPQTRQKRQINHQDTNQKLSKMIQKQIEDRQKWEQFNQQQQKRLRQNAKDLAIINNQQSFSKKMMSQDKLKKINSQKFRAKNIEMNNLFNGNKQDNQEYIRMSNTKKIQEEETSPQIQQRKKRKATELKPLKKKPSTYEVLNQLEFLSRNEQGKIQAVTQQSMKPTNQPSFLKLNKQRVIAFDIPDLVLFNKQSLSKNKYIEGTLKRDRDGVDNTFFPQYRMIFDETNIIYAKKTMAGYDIAMDPLFKPKNSNNPNSILLGTLKGNFKGSTYNLYEKNSQSQILATIIYGSDTSLPYRQVQLYVKADNFEYFQLDRSNPNDRTSNLRTLYLEGENKSKQKIKKYINKKPYFKQATGEYGLDFGGKVTIPSVKNIILVDEQTNQNIMTFGKYSNHKFYLKAQVLSPLVIMGYLMSSFNFKFVTQ